MSFFVFIFFVASGWAHGMIYITHLPESKNDTRYTYHWTLLREALKKTTKEYGPFEIRQAPYPMNERRQIWELQRETDLTVMIRSASLELEKKFIPVRIPLDKGLIGFRVFLIRKEDQGKFSRITSLDQLRKLTVGQGEGWNDVAVWKYNGFKVVVGTYEGLFAMVANGRFNFFSRGVVEVHDEFQLWKKKYPQLAIEKDLLIYYPWPFYFYFSRSAAGKLRAERVRKGLLAVFKDKALFDALFFKYYSKALHDLQIKKRRLFILDNPLLSPETPLHDKQLWFNIQ